MGKSEDKEIGVKAGSVRSKNKIILDVSDTEIMISYDLIYTLRSSTNINSMEHPIRKKLKLQQKIFLILRIYIS